MARRGRRNKAVAAGGAPHAPRQGLQVLNNAVGQMMTMDVFTNQLARLGYGTPNLTEGADYLMVRLSRNYHLLNTLYRNNWVTRRVIDIIPKDMLKNWHEYVTDADPEQIDLVRKLERKTRLRAQLLQGLQWGRLYGGAAGLMMIEGQDDEDSLAEPLDLDAIMPGDYKGLLIADRWAGIYPQLELVEDISDPEFGLPKYYEFRGQNNINATSVKVHHSRIVRFEGSDLPTWEKQAESYWGASVLESVYEELKKRDNTSANIAGLIFLSNLRVLKMEDLAQMLTATDELAQRDLYNTIQMQNYLMSSFNMYVMNKDDDFQSVNASFSGLHEIYECFMMDVSGAAQIPVTKLFGRSPAGMNATGESDMRNYYDVVEGEQEAILRPVLEKLTPVLCMSALGEVPDDIEVHFNPVYTPSSEELGNTVKWKTEAVLNFHDRGIISDQVALKEAKQMSDESGLFSNITDELINAAPDKPVVSEALVGNEETDDEPLDEGE